MVIVFAENLRVIYLTWRQRLEPEQWPQGLRGLPRPFGEACRRGLHASKMLSQILAPT